MVKAGLKIPVSVVRFCFDCVSLPRFRGHRGYAASPRERQDGVRKPGAHARSWTGRPSGPVGVASASPLR
jgi:hypothetical protein